jgi:hypothetical protein
MPTATLLEKLYGGFSTKSIEAKIQALCKGLGSTAHVVEITDSGWIQVEISGEDEIAALSLIEKEFGLAPVEATLIKEGSVYRGKIISPRKNAARITVDIGVLLPAQIDATISLQHLQAQLVNGQKLPLQRITQLFCFFDNFPLDVLIRHAAIEQKYFITELSEEQISRIHSWTLSGLDRVVVLGAFLQDVENAIKTSGHSRDVIEVESLGLLENIVVCKLGTDGAGLIPKIGRRLPNAILGVFSPRKILRFTYV